jgi:hypothetical protein
MLIFSPVGAHLIKNFFLFTYAFNFSDNDFIGACLGGMGYSCRLYKKTIPNCKFIRGQFQIGNFKLTSCNVSKCLYES